MLQTLTKAKRTRSDRVLALTTRAIGEAFNAFVRDASVVTNSVADLLASGDVNAVLDYVDQHIAAFANIVPSAFVDVASAEAVQFGRRLLHKATATVAVTFDQTDPKAAEIMRANRLRLIAGLSQQQRQVTRDALVTGLQEGLSPVQMARRFRQSIGLTAHQMKTVASYERVLGAGSVEALQRELRDRRSDPLVARAIEADNVSDVLSANQIEMMVGRYRDNMIRLRADTIARTEALKVVAAAQEEALRQSLDQTGTNTNLVGKTWNATLDARTRDLHSQRDGERRRLDDQFAPGIMRPGDGPAEESINCRCTLTYEFFDNSTELAAWLGA